MTSDERLSEIHSTLARLESGHLRLDSDISTVRTEMVELKLSSTAEIIHRHNIEKQLGAIQNTLSWVLRVFVGGFLVAAVTFVVNGGLVP